MAWEVIGLPIGLQLLDFEVKRNEGSDSPAGFKSTLQIVTADGRNGYRLVLDEQSV